MEHTQQQHQPSQRNNGVSIKVTIIIFIILIAAGLGVGYYFNEKLADLEDQNATLVSQSQVNQANEAVDGSSDTPLNQPIAGTEDSDTRANTPDRQIITGQARQESPGGDVFVECYVFGDSVDEVWLRYGNTLVPQNQTSRDADAIGETEADVYASALTSIPGSELESGGIYTYRCYGTSSGETVQGGIASFTALVQ